MRPPSTKSTPYDPIADASARHPEWWIGRAELGGRAREVISWDDRFILVDPAAWGGDVDQALTHAVVHIDLHADRTRPRGRDQEEDEADMVTDIRLDRWEASEGAGAEDEDAPTPRGRAA